MDFTDLVRRATGFTPYPYQRRLAEDGLPELLRAPTGTGKSVSAVLPWLWRRRYHPNEDVRTQTPHWLVVALPLRTLVDQFESQVRAWLDNLGLTKDVGMHVLLGGRRGEVSWTDDPGRDAIFIGSIDMLLSRTLNRGYAAGRTRWPIDFGMLNSGTQWVFDEVQLLGPALPTSRQLQSFRDAFGTFLPTQSMWMSATVDPSWLTTVDAPGLGRVFELDETDRTGALRTRIEARRTIQHIADLDARAEAAVAAAALEAHRPGTRTIIIVNTVVRAQKVFDSLVDADVELVLVHSRLRPPDRVIATERAVGEVSAGGLIVVSTQALEAGVDVTSTTLLTELAPWSSIVQRAGRCNRDGQADDARLLWFEPPKAPPYEAAVLARAREALEELEDRAVTGAELASGVLELQPFHPVLRRRDLVELFDTSSDLSGNVTDVSMYIRDADEREVFVGWRRLDGQPATDVRLRPDELVRAPIAEVRKWLQRGGSRVWTFDHLDAHWQPARSDALRPGNTLLAHASTGGYDESRGWDAAVSKPVNPVTHSEHDEEDAQRILPVEDEAASEDALTQIGVWVRLADHLADAEREAGLLLKRLGLDPAVDHRLDAVRRAARLHDIGKVHPVFQATLLAAAGDNEHPSPATMWAKSSQTRRSTHARRYFRHEFVTLLALRAMGDVAVTGPEGSLVRYLAAAHHGWVRLGARSLPDESRDDEGAALVVLGVVDGDELPAVDLPDGERIPSLRLDVASAAALGGAGSWAREALTLRDREDLGPFRLAFLEALVRLSDWAASRRPTRTEDVSAERETSEPR